MSITEFFKSNEEWIDDYTGSDDYAADYEYVIWEDGYRVRKRLSHIMSRRGQSRIHKLIGNDIASRLKDYQLVECLVCDQYAREHENTLDWLDETEYEDQVDWSRIIDQLPGITPEAMEAYCQDNREFCLQWSGGKYPCVYHTVYLGKRIEYYVSDETLDETITECILNYCSRKDS